VNVRLLTEGPVLEIDGEKYHHHPNGGGLVAETAKVGKTAFIGPFAQIRHRATVDEGAKVDDRAMVAGDAFIASGSVLLDTCYVFGRASILGAEISGNSRIHGEASIPRNWGKVHNRDIDVT